MTYDYEAKGRADFLAGAKDERLYLATNSGGEDYRRGWQLARVAPESPPPAVKPEDAPTPTILPRKDTPDSGAKAADDSQLSLF